VTNISEIVTEPAGGAAAGVEDGEEAEKGEGEEEKSGLS
jgi:hypothetical protein